MDIRSSRRKRKRRSRRMERIKTVGEGQEKEDTCRKK